MDVCISRHGDQEGCIDGLELMRLQIVINIETDLFNEKVIHCWWCVILDNLRVVQACLYTVQIVKIAMMK